MDELNGNKVLWTPITPIEMVKMMAMEITVSIADLCMIYALFLFRRRIMLVTSFMSCFFLDRDLVPFFPRSRIISTSRVDFSSCQEFVCHESLRLKTITIKASKRLATVGRAPHDVSERV